MQLIKQHIRDNKVAGAYLFVGQELFIKNTYIDILKNHVLSENEQAMNLDQFDANNKDFNQIAGAMDTLPFMADKRLIITKSMGLSKRASDNKVEAILDALERLPETTVVVICEEDVESSSKLYKWMQKKGSIVEFKPLDEQGLSKYIIREFAKEGLLIDSGTAVYMSRYVGMELTLIHQEIQKLISYKVGKDKISRKDIEVCCTKNIENKIYDIMNAIGKKNQSKAIELYHDLLNHKEKPLRILNLITKQFRQMLQCKILREKNVKNAAIVKRTGLNSYVVKKTLEQGVGYSVQQIKKAMQDCLDTEMSVKTGAMKPEMAVELLILKYSQK